MTAPYRIEILAGHSRGDFDCGENSLNDYLQRRANQDQRNRFAVCYLLIEQQSDQIAGYYTLSSGGVALTELPEKQRKGLPRYPSVPVARIGRLAVANSYQGRGLGGVLLFDAVKRAASSDIGIFAILVDAINDQAVKFYEHHGFMSLTTDPRMLFIPVSDALKQIFTNDTRH